MKECNPFWLGTNPGKNCRYLTVQEIHLHTNNDAKQTVGRHEVLDESGVAAVECLPKAGLHNFFEQPEHLNEGQGLYDGLKAPPRHDSLFQTVMFFFLLLQKTQNTLFT